MEITQQNIEESLSGSATVKFKVAKSWLTENSLSSGDVAMFRYTSGSWSELPTTMGEDDGTYVHFTATTPGFSYFVIGEKAETMAAAPAAGSEESDLAEAVPEEEVTAEEAAETEPIESSSNAAVWVVPVLVLILIVALLVWYWKRR